MAQDDSSAAKIIPKYILWMRGLVPFWVLRHSFLSLTGCLWQYNIQLKTSRGYSFCLLLMSMSEAFSISFILYETLLHKSSEQSSLISGPRLNSSPLEAKNPGIFCGSTTTFQQSPRLLGPYQTHQHSNYRDPRRREKERVWENFWRNYSWKFPQHGERNSQSTLRSTKSPIQD